MISVAGGDVEQNSFDPPDQYGPRCWSQQELVVCQSCIEGW